MTNGYPPLETVTKPALTTEEAAYYLNRAPQTLRLWAMDKTKTPPVKPLKICGRLAWPTIKVKMVLGMEFEAAVQKAAAEMDRQEQETCAQQQATDNDVDLYEVAHLLHLAELRNHAH